MIILDSETQAVVDARLAEVNAELASILNRD
jgi:hypothetical protein